MTVVYKLLSTGGLPIHLKAPNAYGSPGAESVPNLRCPHCMHMGAFTKGPPNDLSIQHIEIKNGAPYEIGRSIIGIRVCPNRECKGVVLAVIDINGGAIVLPGEVLDFDPTDIPGIIASSLEEAIKCHSAQCYKAAALMVRRVLEELCEERGAKGNNLKDRIVALSKLIVIPQELIAGADKLRLLGNDAAHIEAKTYETVGEPEVRLSIDLTKELLKASYQYKGLLARLAALEKPAS